MKWFNKIMVLITIFSALVISITIFLNAQQVKFEEQQDMTDTFIFDLPLKKITLEYENPGRRNLDAEKLELYKGTRISLAEYTFDIDADVKQVEYEFEIPESIIKEKDVNPETIKLYTVLNDTIVEAGGQKNNNTIVLQTKKLVPILVLAEPNEETQITEEEIYANSRSNLDKAYTNLVSIVKNPAKLGFTILILITLLMTLYLVIKERKKLPEPGDSDTQILHYVQDAKKEGLSDEEIIANLIEQGISPSHADILVSKR